MAEPMVDVPAVVQYGRITGRFERYDADSPDEGNAPDSHPLQGTVTLTPRAAVTRWPTAEPPRLAVVSTVTCRVVDGDLYPPVGEEPGVWVIATDQPQGLPTTIQWTASFQFKDVIVQPSAVVFNVPAGGAVDLATIVPASPEPGTVTVVSTESLQRAEDAAERAEAAAQRAEAGVPGPPGPPGKQGVQGLSGVLVLHEGEVVPAGAASGTPILRIP